MTVLSLLIILLNEPHLQVQCVSNPTNYSVRLVPTVLSSQIGKLMGKKIMLLVEILLSPVTAWAEGRGVEFTGGVLTVQVIFIYGERETTRILNVAVCSL